MKATEIVKNHLTANMEMKKKDIIIGNFLGGLFWGIGTVVGASVIFGSLGWILNILGFFDIFKGFPPGPLNR